MSAVDFGDWAAPSLELHLDGRVYSVQPPSVAAARKLLASAVRAEVNLGLVVGEIPAAVQEVLDTIGPDDHPALGAAYQQMVDDGLSQQTIDRAAYYATFYWARGREYASWLAKALWSPVEPDPDGGEAAPKAS